MANWLSSNGPTKFRVTVPTYSSNNYYIEYEILVQFPNSIYWKLNKRYSDFLRLNDELANYDSKFKVYFPPKKIFKNTSEHFLIQRRKSLEMYMNEVISIINNYLPRPLATFLEMDKYEIHGITTNLAKLLFTQGQALLMSNKAFEISVLSIYSINQRMLSPASTNIYNKTSEDFGNVLEVVESIKSIKIVPLSICIQGHNSLLGTSNIKSESLPFDISIFSGTKILELNSVNIANMRGLYKMNANIELIKVHHCLKSCEDILFGDLVYRGSKFEDLLNFDGPWRCAKTVDFSKNSITSIDKSIVTLNQVSNLNLSYNQISTIKNLNYLTFLTELDLSYNNLVISQDVSLSNKLGSIKNLVLKGNNLSKLTLIDRMFSLEYLDISDNNISEFKYLLPLCRLTCLEVLLLKHNPICYHQQFLVVLFDILLDQLNTVRINGSQYFEIPFQLQSDINNRRNLKEALLLHTTNFQLQSENSSESGFVVNDQDLLMSIDIPFEEEFHHQSILNIPDVFNIIVYWFYSVTRRTIIPNKILWCTEIFPPNRSLKPVPILLISNNSSNTSILKCSVKTATKNGNQMITIEPCAFIDLNMSLQTFIIGADKLFIRFDMSGDQRSLYLVSNSQSLDSFIDHLYHIEEELVLCTDSKLCILNEEDRFESLRRFIDVWRIDLKTNLRRAGDNREINVSKESEIMFSSRARLQMQNGFQLFLTIVVTRQMFCLVDERIYDWPDLVKRPNFSDSSTSNSSSLTSSSSNQFQFLRTNAYFFHQIKSCMKILGPCNNNMIAGWCPVFAHCLQVSFYPSSLNPKEPINLYFESAQKTDEAYNIINKLCENEGFSLPINISISEPTAKPHIPVEIPAHLKFLNSSFHEVRLSVSLYCPKLSVVAQHSNSSIVSFCHSKTDMPESTKLYGVFWTKFMFCHFESCNYIKEIPGLVCLSSDQIFVIYETEEIIIAESDCWSDPESDQPDNSNNCSKINTLSIDLDNIFKIYVGLSNQWVTLCCRTDENSSETTRLVLIMRNNDLTKQFINWMKMYFKDQLDDECLSDKLIKLNDDENVDELLLQIQKTARCDSIDFIHYTGVEDIRFDYPLMSSHCNSITNEAFTYAVVVSSANISVIRHNVIEYPLRLYGCESVRQLPENLQYEILSVIPLYDCIQLQLPGHDKNLLVMVIQSRHQDHIGQAFKIQLSISCQKEQKHLIDKLRQEWSKCLQSDRPLRVIVC